MINFLLLFIISMIISVSSGSWIATDTGGATRDPSSNVWSKSNVQINNETSFQLSVVAGPPKYTCSEVYNNISLSFGFFSSSVILSDSGEYFRFRQLSYFCISPPLSEFFTSNIRSECEVFDGPLEWHNRSHLDQAQATSIKDDRRIHY